MGYICPVCNGLSSLEGSCSNCFHSLDDYGRVDNLWEPYSPYREIDDIKLDNGYDDFKNHLCVHLATCPSCGKDHIVNVQETYESNSI